MEASALWISHTSCISSSALLSSSKRWKWQLAFNRRYLPSIDSRRSCCTVNNVASKRNTTKLVDPSPSIQQKQENFDLGVALDALKPDSASVASSIKYHSEFTPSFFPELFELPKAYYATAASVRDMLIINWNATYDYYDKINVKQAYYLSMEYLQGRALLNAVGNLELTGAYADALKKLGHNLEDVAGQTTQSITC